MTIPNSSSELSIPTAILVNRAGLFAVFCCAADCSLHTFLHPQTSETTKVTTEGRGHECTPPRLTGTGCQVPKCGVSSYSYCVSFAHTRTTNKWNMQNTPTEETALVEPKFSPNAFRFGFFRWSKESTQFVHRWARHVPVTSWRFPGAYR